MSAASSRLAALICLLLGFLGTLPMIVLTPPLQVPDEGQHLARAYQLSELRIWSRAENGRVGDDLPTSLGDFTARFLGSTQEHVLHRVVAPEPLRETLAERARPLAPEARSFLGFQGAAYYAPFAYIPQALAMRIARAFDASPLMLLYAGRLANALVAVALLACAVLVAPVGREMLVVVGLLPMTLYQDASLSPDATMMGCAFLLTAIALGAQARGRWRPLEIVAAIVTGTVLCSLKPVYAPLLLVGLVPDVFRGDRRGHVLGVHLLIVATVAAVSLLWAKSTAAVFSQTQPGADAHEQVVYVLQHPTDFLLTVLATLILNASRYTQSMIGVFGWGSVELPPVLLVLPLVATLAVLVFRERPTTRGAAPAALWQLLLTLACAFLVMTSLYVVWTPVGYPLVKGVQGRYFLPALALAAIAASRLVPPMPGLTKIAPTKILSILACVVAAQVVASDLTIVSAYSVL